MCGGTTTISLKMLPGMGLSPRVRGNQGGSGLERRGEGTIPAYAGEPADVRAIWPSSRDYPRVCGGTAFQGAENAIVEGLSPRVRGNPLLVAVLERQLGTIPACAGEPRD